MSAQEIATIVYREVQKQRALDPARPALIGIAGAQGSGKTTACRLLEAANRPRFAHFSLDDVYLTRAERQRLARDAHPLFITRGPPGTHDLELARSTISALAAGGESAQTRLPRFDKAIDDRAPTGEWPVFGGRPEAILIDGWCVGALPDSGGPPINPLEADEDAEGSWRRQINNKLSGDYGRFFARFDAIVYLRPPSWEIVRVWRGQQESENLGRPLTAADEARLDRFLQHYERITRNMMAGLHTATRVVQLNDGREIVAVLDVANPPTSPA